MIKQLSALALCCATFIACSKQQPIAGASKTDVQIAAKPAPAPVTYLTGDAADVTTSAIGGLILMGGSTDVDAAIQWFLQRAAGGDVVVIRSSGADGYNQYMFNMVNVHSVETIIIDSREKASLSTVAQKIRNAEALFIAGGDQLPAHYKTGNGWRNQCRSCSTGICLLQC